MRLAKLTFYLATLNFKWQFLDYHRFPYYKFRYFCILNLDKHLYNSKPKSVLTDFNEPILIDISDFV